MMKKQPVFPTILLIEPDHDCQQLVRSTLSREGYRTLVASQWQQGMKLALESRPDLVLQSLNLSDIDGDALAIRLHSIPELSTVPIVALTEHKDGREMIAAGCAARLKKPIDPELLIDRVIQVLDGKRELMSVDERASHLETLLQSMATRLETRTLTMNEQSRQLREANQIRDNFLIAASRELRTPLTLITGYVALLQSTLSQLDMADSPLSLPEMVEGLAQGSRRLDYIVQELIRISRLVAGDINLAIGPVRINALVANTLDELDPAQQKQILLTTLDDLPIIQADGAQIQLTMRNILNQLLHTIPADETITVSGECQDDIVILAFQSAGLGLNPAEQESIFDQFYPTRSDEDQERNQGKGSELGYGLAVAKGIIQAHGGRIWVESNTTNDKMTSTFYALLPIHVPAEHAGAIV